MAGAPIDGYIHRSHLVDTGCPYDLVGAENLQECDSIRKATEDVVLATANGESACQRSCRHADWASRRSLFAVRHEAHR